MNREIKFRGRRVDNGEWVYGDLTRYSEEMSYITVDLIDGMAYEVHRKTVGQFIGLVDIKKTEIYDNCKLKNKFGVIDTIKWHDGGYYLFRNGNPIAHIYQDLIDSMGYKVIDEEAPDQKGANHAR